MQRIPFFVYKISVRIEVSEGNIFADGRGRIAARAAAVCENELRYSSSE